MNDKFTIRDFFAYFLSGCAFFIAFYLAELKSVNSFLFLQRENIKNYSTVLIFASLPILYFVGQTIQSVDTLFYSLGCKVWQLYLKQPSKFKKGMCYLITSHRISGNLNLRNISKADFWKKCSELELVSKYGHSEYWYIMNDLFKGLTLINLLFMIYSIANSHLMIGVGFAFTTFLFWYRARYYAMLFIDSVNCSRDALEYIKPENIK